MHTTLRMCACGDEDVDERERRMAREEQVDAEEREKGRVLTRVQRPWRIMSMVDLIDGSFDVNGAATLACCLGTV